jgi:peptide/nickel transport system permease protein
LKLSARNEARVKELRYSLYLLRRNSLTVAGIAVVVALIIMALFADVIVPYPSFTDLSQRLLPPSSTHLFGTDDLGRDLFARIVHGSRISLSIGIVSVSLAGLLGTSLGLLSGYYGGKVDELIMRVADIFLSVPSLVLALLIMATLGPSLYNAMIAIAITIWPRYSRVTRGVVLSLREQLFIEAARAVSARDRRIILNHILPNCVGPLTVQASLDYGDSILLAASLGFLGLGVNPPTPEWGALVAVGRQFLPRWWWYVTFPGIFIAIAVLGFNLLGDGLRDILDPRLRR